MKKLIAYIRHGYSMKTKLVKVGEEEVEVITNHGSVIWVDGICYEQVCRGPRIGVIVSTGKGKIGFSLLSPFETRKRNWNLAIDLATKRAEGITDNPLIPDFVRPQLAYMNERSQRYFN
jgi:hypothetical protein